MKNPADPVPSLVGPLEELYLVSFLAEQENPQEKIEKALRVWASKWLISMNYDELIDQVSIDQLADDLKRDMQAKLLEQAKRRMSEAMVMSCCSFIENPVETVETIQVNTKPNVGLRRYSMFALRKWEK